MQMHAGPSKSKSKTGRKTAKGRVDKVKRRSKPGTVALKCATSSQCKSCICVGMSRQVQLTGELMMCQNELADAEKSGSIRSLRSFWSQKRLLFAL